MKAIYYLIVLMLFSCNKKDDVKKPTTKQVLNNEKYGLHERNVMDVYLPENRSSQTPVVILIHGGGWVAGDKKDLNAVQEILLNNDIASISINYRYVSSTIHYNHLMEDVNAAVSYVSTNAGNWNISSKKFTIVGNSAGAHMALLYGYKYDTDNKISSIISVAGPTDFTINDFHLYASVIGLSQNLNNLAGAQFELFKPIPQPFIDASPIAQVVNKPTFIIHGDADIVVPFDQAIRLRDKLKSLDYTYKFHQSAGANHDAGFSNEETAEVLYQSIIEWIKKYS